MKKFLILSILTLIMGVAESKACLSEWTINYYMFYACNSSNNFDFSKYWSNYVGSPVEPYFNYNTSILDEHISGKSSFNPVYVAAIKKNDKEMLDYFRILAEYYTYTGDKYNQWDYPTEQELQLINSNLEGVMKKAKNYKGTRLISRYDLLMMRCLFQLGKYAEVEKFWTANGRNNYDEEAIKNTMLGLLAGALYHQKKFTQAVRIFAQINDIQSVKYCLDDKRNYNGIREIYEKYPNDDCLPFLIQDFVNMYQETIDANNHPFDFYSVSNNEARNFIALANKAAQNNSVRNPMMWKTASALLLYYLGDRDEALKSIDEALKLTGPDFMRDNARIIKFFIYTKDNKIDKSNQAYYLSELKWLKEKSKITDNDNFYVRASQRILGQNIVPAHDGRMGALLAKYANSIGCYCDDVYYKLPKQLSINNLEQLLFVLDNPKKANNLEKWLISNVKFSRDEINDIVGTRYLGEMNFNKAEEYLNKVPINYYKSCALGNYFYKRDFNIQRWKTKQREVNDWEDLENADSKTITNKKLEYVSAIKTMIDKVNSTTGYENCRNNISLASLYLQASRWGDCWFLLEYDWHVYAERTSAQKLYEQKALECIEIVKSCSDKAVKREAHWAEVWIRWRDYQYYSDSWYVDNYPITSEMKSSFSQLKQAINYNGNYYNTGKCDFVADNIDEEW